MSEQEWKKDEIFEKKLLEAIGNVDDQYILEAAPLNKRKISVFRIGLVAASLVIVVLAGLGIGEYKSYQESLPKETKAPIRAPFPENDIGVEALVPKFYSLDELIEYLGENEVHVDDTEVEFVNLDASKAGEVKDSVQYENYVYKIIDNKVNIMDTSKEDQGFEMVIDCRADYVSVAGERLAVIDTDDDENSIKIFNIENPKLPVELCEYTQNGKKVAVYTKGNDLYVMTNQEKCCCEYSKGDALTPYKPEITFAGDSVEVDDGEIEILWGTTRLEYLTVTKLNMESCAKLDKKVIYGDITKVYLDNGVFMVETGGSNEEIYINPSIHIFDSDLQTKDVIDIAREFLVEKQQIDNKSDYIQLLEVVDLIKNENVYQIVVQYTYLHKEYFEEDITEIRIGAISYDELFKRSKSALERGGNVTFLGAEDVVWDGSKAVCYVEIKEENVNALVKIDFENMQLEVDASEKEN